MRAPVTVPLLCHSNEENGCYACINGHLTTADQSEIRSANLVSLQSRVVCNTFRRK